MFCLHVCPCTCVYLVPQRPGEGIRCLTDNCKLLCECWEPNAGPLEERPALLAAQPPLLPLNDNFI